MHPLRLLLYVSLALAASVAAALGFALLQLGVPRAEAIVFGGLAFGAFMLPWTGVYLWALRRASDLDTLIDRTQALVEGDAERAITDRPYHGEVDDLARAVDELRVAMLREQAWSAQRLATLQQIAAALGEGLLALSAGGRVVLANEPVAEMFGAGRDVIGRPLLEVVRNHTVAAAFDRAREGETSTDRITAGARQIEVRVFPVADSPEVAAVGLFIDITKLEQLQRIRKEFLDDFSHEVRTPLAGLRSAVETFDAGALTEEQEQQLRSVMLRQLARIERLVQDLSELNRIESGELVLERREVDLNALVSELVEEFRERLADKPLRLTLRGEPALARVDPTRAAQILVNLLDNAWKYGGPHGEILVEVGQEEGAAVVRVSDEGEGIPPAELERIFNRFYRVDRSRSQTVPGVGLGLAIAKHLVLLHGGTIRACNRAGGGATFEVRLP
ncbi:MAG TPA: ATP-binding protein [Thermoanaerobaculia bacterium]|jgi:two-component system phosphate regulon sensor histidine kinase PhoR|nr:ATP-binding protein [Thermoanaerobaculia bacterium]